MSNKQEKHTEQREIKEGYCPECGKELPLIDRAYSNYDTTRCVLCDDLILMEWDVKKTFVGYRIFVALDKNKKVVGEYGPLLPPTNSQHRSGIGEEEIVERILDIHYFDNVHFKKVRVTLRSIDGIEEELRKVLRSQPPTPNAPSPDKDIEPQHGLRGGAYYHIETEPGVIEEGIKNKLTELGWAPPDVIEKLVEALSSAKGELCPLLYGSNSKASKAHTRKVYQQCSKALALIDGEKK